MQIRQKLNSDCYILCICEGSSELVVINMLLDHDKLIFRRDQLVAGKPVRRESVSSIQDKYLNFSFHKPVYILRIIDSKSEGFKLKKLYRDRFDDNCIVNVFTCPEIEILLIINNGDYDNYTNQYKSKMKPSDYCKEKYGIRHVKKSKTFQFYFQDVDMLITSIKTYARYTRRTRSYTLSDLLRN